jgi:hypothetical protein
MEFVQRLAADLQRAGLDVWWDISDIQGSDVWERKIQEGLNSSQYIIVVLTPASLESRWVRREYLSADNKGLRIIPLKLKASNDLPLTLRDIQPIDAVNRTYADTLSEVLRIINGKARSSLTKEGDKSQLSPSLVGVIQSKELEEQILPKINTPVNSTSSPTFASTGILEIGGAILPIVYFILAGLYPFGFDNNSEEFFLGFAALLTGVFFVLDRQMIVGRRIKISIVLYVLTHIVVVYANSSGWGLANIPEILEGVIALVVAGFLISNFRTSRRPAPYASIFLAVFFCLIGAKLLLNRFGLYPSDFYTFIIIAGIVASILLWLEQ